MRCDICGVKLIKEGNVYLCPNHGIVFEEQEESNNKTPNYVG